MHESNAFPELIAVWFLKGLGVLLVVLYFAFVAAPFLGTYFAIRLFLPEGGHVLAMAGALLVMFFCWWLFTRPRVRRTNAAFEYLVATCLKNDQPWRLVQREPPS